MQLTRESPQLFYKDFFFTEKSANLGFGAGGSSVNRIQVYIVQCTTTYRCWFVSTVRWLSVSVLSKKWDVATLWTDAALTLISDADAAVTAAAVVSSDWNIVHSHRCGHSCLALGLGVQKIALLLNEIMNFDKFYHAMPYARLTPSCGVCPSVHLSVRPVICHVRVLCENE